MIGWLEAAWRKGLSTRPTLDPDALWAKALKDAPAHGEGGPRSDAEMADFRLRLEILAESLQAEAQLNSLGLTMAHGQLVRVIRQRLHLGALWQREPELLQTPLAPPIIVVGQMRSGTTRVHRLLAADPALSSTRFCDSWHPVPRTPDTRPAWSALSLMFARALDPWLDTIHPFGVTRADEELGWLAAALDHCAYEAQWRIPTFTAFSEGREPGPVYREFARMLRTDAAWHGSAERPRVLKVPQFAEDLPTLLAQFPDARVVLTKRCEEDLVRSSASLVANQMAIQSNAVDYAWIEQEVARKIALRDARMDSALAQFDGALAVVDFDRLNEDWEGEIMRIYRDLDLPFSAHSLAAMREEQRKAQSSAHHEHARQMQRFARSSA
ncbi:sulfotransferase [Aurantiacibacter sp. MUD11]|uniref:sulfotransferase family protein n=1 Tax=Aurantiacibacter sp. MUD11 TaxID=3003265 RepID=UPI0022AA68EA|nr:sulfotransferase [Aurantiacibacter sp. MUD11]WAT18872.1 sulfotransferase [Aurantiacibacter sp. MUD11]